jgi:hypothetical protein
MFSISSQKSSWMFESQQEVEDLRREANERFIVEHRAEADGPDEFTHFLSVDEEKAPCFAFSCQS